MKLICETCTINRAVTGGSRAFQRTILAIGKGSERKEDGIKIMLIKNGNTAGIKYNVLKNISKVFTRFLEEGKATISFLAPEHDVQIKSDQVQLKAFLKVLKLVLSGASYKPSEGGPAQQTATNPFPPSAPPRLPCLTVGKKKASILGSTSVLKTKAVITNRKDYPRDGFQRQLVSLQISNLRMVKFDTQILLLQKLRHLNLSNNCLQKLPRRLGQMHLREVDLSDNKLAECSWDWLLEPNIQSSLQSLNISNNGLSFLPYNVTYATSLVTLTAKDNYIRKLPFAIWHLKGLRVLTLTNNRIDAVPETFEKLKLEKVDFSGNRMFSLAPDLRPDPTLSVRLCQPSTLFELTARTVLNRKIPYASPGLIPSTVADTLHRVPLCRCGQPCFDLKVYQAAKSLSAGAGLIVTDANQYLVADCVFCSVKCMPKV
uniref:PIF1/LRR1 pleckstrin homology domain-containing protein n=1 Tax=Anopheles epiroticus TaxID=199890 RepID=A0A182PXQ4_9DIPT